MNFLGGTVFFFLIIRSPFYIFSFVHPVRYGAVISGNTWPISVIASLVPFCHPLPRFPASPRSNDRRRRSHLRLIDGRDANAEPLYVITSKLDVRS